MTRRTLLLGALDRDNPCACADRSAVALVQGATRRRMIYDALTAIDDRILPLLRLKKRVLIKPNVVNADRPLAVTHPDALCGILDYVAERFRGPVTIAESSYDNTTANFSAYGYPNAVREFRNIEFVDFNAEGRYELIHLADRHLHMLPVRLAARLFDPDAFIICSAILKTHNVVLATLSVKNMVMGAPLHAPGGADNRTSDKRKYHEGVRQSNYSMFQTAQKLAPFWGVAVIDGYQGMEGNGPSEGTAVDSRVAIASTDFIAADRVGVECMGIDPGSIGYLSYCGQGLLGTWDLSQIDIRGTAPEVVKRTYRLHQNVEQQRLWQGDLPDSPANPRIG